MKATKKSLNEVWHKKQKDIKKAGRPFYWEYIDMSPTATSITSEFVPTHKVKRYK